jgi:hypothetical protein
LSAFSRYRTRRNPWPGDFSDCEKLLIADC